VSAMSTELILNRLQMVRRNGDGWTARCPAHEDRSPSLSVHERDGKTLLFCHAGCSQSALLTALRIEPRELSLDTADKGPRIVAEYPYTDENGVLLYQVVRLEPKSFRQRRPDGNGGWHWNLNGARKVLYRLPEVLTAKSVLVVEGEKDVETARGLRLTATCNSGGAGKWQDAYSGSLRGKSICIIADDDEPGRKHGQRVSESLHPRAQSLKVLELPGAKDLGEWVEKGGTREGLLALISNTPEWKSSEKTKQTASGFTLTPLGDLLARPDVPVEYVVENLLVAGTVSCIAAKPKVGKSTFARNLCLAVSRGDDFLGLKTKQCECLYLALEEREEDIKRSFQAMGADGSEPIYIHAAAAPAEGISALCELVRQRRPGLVVIDPLFRLAHIRDEKAYGETYAALGPLIDVAREFGTHVVLTHHSGKSAKADAIDSPLGSTAIGGAVCTLVLLKRSDSVRTVQTVQRIGQDMPETILQFDLDVLSLGAEKSEAEVRSFSIMILEYLRSAEEEAKTREEIEAQVEGDTGPKRKALRHLVEKGKVKREGTGRRGAPFRYRCLFACLQDTEKTTKQETEKEHKTRINTGDTLVCNSLPDSNRVPGPKTTPKTESAPTTPTIEFFL
jgi:putative DNA primase/helicase